MADTRTRILLALMFAAGAGRDIPAQSPATVTVRVDNDAFNFWQYPADRPDEEYTSGVRLTYTVGARAWWARLLTRALPDCVYGAIACRERVFSFGQDIYTPRRTHDSATAAPGSRPNAAWLYASDGVRRLHETHMDELSIAVGVTGPPALGAFTQRVAHGFAPSFNRPTDWSGQIAFEPGVVVNYAYTHRLVHVSFGRLEIDALPRANALLGNVETSLEGGIMGRAGWNLRHPWLPPGNDAPLSVTFAAGASGRAVARDLFLDGSTFQSGPRVGHRTFTHQAEWSLTLQHQRFTLGYHVVTDGREYRFGPSAHTWSSLVAGVTFAR